MRKYLGYATGDAADKGAASTVAAMEVMYRGGPAILFSPVSEPCVIELDDGRFRLYYEARDAKAIAVF